MCEVGIIVLAAGASSRMGQPKQLLKINGHTLIRHILGIASKSTCSPIIVVLGNSASLLEKEISGLPVSTVVNENWEEGMGSSVAKGVAELLVLQPEIKAVILLVVDQPFVDVSIIEKLKQKYLETGKKIIAAKYGETYGVPALFDAVVFPELLKLKGQSGAKKVISGYVELHEVDFVDFPGGALDLDTPEDYQRLKRDF